MRTLALALLVVTLPALAQQDTTSLVEASKNAKAKRRTSTSKVITNKDVTKAKSKLIELPPKELPAVPATQTPVATTMEQHQANRKAQSEAEARIAAAEQAVKDLEVELAKVEQAYFEENDLNKRDRQIVPEFAAVKEKLAAAKAKVESEKNGTNGTDRTDGISH